MALLLLVLMLHSSFEQALLDQRHSRVYIGDQACDGQQEALRRSGAARHVR